MTSANLPGPPSSSLSRRELLAIAAGAGAVGVGVVLTGEFAADDQQTYADIHGRGSAATTVELDYGTPLVANAVVAGEFPEGSAPSIAVELVSVGDEEQIFRATDTGSVTERAKLVGSGTHRFRVESDGEFRATLRHQEQGLF